MIELSPILKAYITFFLIRNLFACYINAFKEFSRKFSNMSKNYCIKKPRSIPDQRTNTQGLRKKKQRRKMLNFK